MPTYFLKYTHDNLGKCKVLSDYFTLLKVPAQYLSSNPFEFSIRHFLLTKIIYIKIGTSVIIINLIISVQRQTGNSSVI